MKSILSTDYKLYVPILINISAFSIVETDMTKLWSNSPRWIESDLRSKAFAEGRTNRFRHNVLYNILYINGAESLDKALWPGVTPSLVKEDS